MSVVKNRVRALAEETGFANLDLHLNLTGNRETADTARKVIALTLQVSKQVAADEADDWITGLHLCVVLPMPSARADVRREIITDRIKADRKKIGLAGASEGENLHAAVLFPVQLQEVLNRFHNDVVDAATTLDRQDLQLGQKLGPDPKRGSDFAIICLGRSGCRGRARLGGHRRRMLSEPGRRSVTLWALPCASSFSTMRHRARDFFPLQPSLPARSRQPSGR